MKSKFFSPKCPGCGSYLTAYIRVRRQDSEIERCDGCSAIVRYQSYKTIVWLIFFIALIPNNLHALVMMRFKSEILISIYIYVWFFIVYIFCYKIQFFELYKPVGDAVFRDIRDVNPFKRILVYTTIYIIFVVLVMVFF